MRVPSTSMFCGLPLVGAPKGVLPDTPPVCTTRVLPVLTRTPPVKLLEFWMTTVPTLLTLLLGPVPVMLASGEPITRLVLKLLPLSALPLPVRVLSAPAMVSVVPGAALAPR